jgi:signal transduction histidine kinase
MRIQTRLFFGTAALVLALMAVQLWLHARQLSAIEGGIGTVATTVGQRILDEEFQVFARKIETSDNDEDIFWFDRDSGEVSDDTVETDVHVLRLPDGSEGEITRRITKVLRHDPPGELIANTTEESAVAVGVATECESEDVDVFVDHFVVAPAAVAKLEGRRIELRVIPSGDTAERVLVVSHEDGAARQIPIQAAPTVQRVRGTSRQGIVFSAGLLMVGLVGSGVLASRLTRPLRRLADGADALGRGDLGIQVPETASGEVGDLQRAFNRMSQRLSELESEREVWRRKEHLAQLGDLSRGLAHTVRNPLNTLGLAVEELARDGNRQVHLVATARAQIRRIDRWLRSFLALGAGDAAEMVSDDLCALAQDVVLEAIQEGVRIDMTVEDQSLPVRVVPTAIRAALGNLVENAADASPRESPVTVTIGRDGLEGMVTVVDRGPGIPDEVRERLYAPHVTTKVGGSGMGLFLARQLVVDLHGGNLEVRDRTDGGTVAEVRLPLVAAAREPDESVQGEQ